MARRVVYFSVVGLLASTLIFASCSNKSALAGSRDSRLSSAVALMYEGENVEKFLQQPSIGYVQGYFRFDPTLPDDIIIALDQEFFDGTTNPQFVRGGDWMSFVGIQRAGGVWIGAGTQASLKGEPSSERDWKIIDLKTRLQPNVWYLLRIESDFSTRHFKTLTISGGGLERTLDISQHPLDYPNMIPFNQRAMGYFFAAIRNRNMAQGEGSTLVYFDDMEGGMVAPDGTQQRLFYDGFEMQPSIGNQPAPLSAIDLKKYTQGYWYLEREESIVSTQAAAFARTGTRVGVANASLQ